ncbi:MAG TPA: hypothetical protein PK350_14725 [Deltaproteobacteria bacterium]|nr:hypothetical protein [Deltaproteobacteria bacterium]HPR53700.1 hypothetical protein [Deltaproteobacteria bacterium]
MRPVPPQLEEKVKGSSAARRNEQGEKTRTPLKARMHMPVSVSRFFSLGLE